MRRGDSLQRVIRDVPGRPIFRVSMAKQSTEEPAELHDRAYAASDRGDLTDAARLFGQLLAQHPDDRYYHYMRGLALKYARDWRGSLAHNLRAIELAEGDASQAEHWNAAIAATALGDWQRARQLWRAQGIGLPAGEGPIDADFGVAVVRLNPWHGGETVFMRRIDPVRARLLNVPLPESGHRFGDIVLHDGAATGYRFDGGERKVPVFNELQRLTASGFQTFVAFVGCDSPDDAKALVDATAPGIGHVEDWTSGIAHYCLRCSYGTPHRHDDRDSATQWAPERTVGIAAQSRRAVEKLLADWAQTSRSRRIDAIETRECVAPEPQDGSVWWQGPEEHSQPEADTSPSSAP